MRMFRNQIGAPACLPWKPIRPFVASSAKGRLSPLLEAIPVRVIRNERTALLGAARCAMLDCAGR